MLQTKNYNLIIEKENLNKNNFIGSGFSGKVYYYKNNNSQLAIKIFDDYYLSFYDNKMEEFENLYKSFQQINTEYILMPQYLLYEENNFKAIGSLYKENFLKKQLFNMNIDDFKKALNNLINELNYLSTKKIMACDISYDNLILNNNNLYICDIGEFDFGNYQTEEFIRSENINCLIEGFVEMLSINMNIYNTEDLRDEYIYRTYDFLDYFDKDSQDCKIISDYVKKKSKIY